MKDYSGKESRPEKRLKWSNHIQAWRESGWSQAQYCREHKLSPGLFFYWKKRIEESRLSDVRLVPVDMHPIRFHPAELTTSSLVLHLGQYKVEIGDRFDPGTLARLVQTLDRI